jgi:hypothetical protein
MTLTQQITLFDVQNSFTYIVGYFKWPSLKSKLINVTEGLNGIRIPSEINPLLKERVSVLCVAKAFQKQP